MPHISALYVDDKLVDFYAARFPNPSCRPWCTKVHDADEFVRGDGMIWCQRAFREAPRWQVYVEQVTKARMIESQDADDALAAPLEVLPPTMSFGELNDISAEDAYDFTVAVAAASAFIAKITEPARKDRL